MLIVYYIVDNIKNEMKKALILIITFSTIIFAQSWVTLRNMPVPVVGGQAVVVDSMIYILGGFSEQDNSNINLIQQYNPASDSWQTVGKMIVPRSNFVAGNYHNKIAYFGGVKNIMQNMMQDSSSLELWDKKNSPSKIGNNQVFNRLYSTGIFAGDNIFLFGGSMMSKSSYLAEYNIPSSSVVYSYNNDTLFPGPPIMQMSAIIGENIYIFGGISGGLEGFPQSSIIKFDTTLKTFYNLQVRLDKPRAGGTSVSLGNEIYIIGGFHDDNSPLSSVRILTINNDGSAIVNDGPEMNFARVQPMAVNYKGSIYVFGGADENNQPVSAVEKLDVITSIPKTPAQVATGFKLENNYPNPFNPTTQISFTIAKTSHVSLDVYSILGEHVKNITSKIYAPGNYRVSWNGTNNYGIQVAGGIYIYKLSSDYFTESKKMILLK